MPSNAQSSSVKKAFDVQSSNISVPGAVLIYSHSWIPGQFDGVAVRMMAQVEALVERGVKVTLVTPDFVIEGEGSQEVPQFTRIPGVEHITLHTGKTPVYRKNMCMELSVRNFKKLVSVIQRTKPDLVHGTQEASMQVLATACIYCDVPLVVSLHTDVAQIASADAGFSAALGSGTAGRLLSWISVRMTYWGYRNWGLAGAYYFPVSEQSKAILANAGVRRALVASNIWGPMVDRKLFTIDMPQNEVEETRARLSFGMKDAYILVYVGRVTAEKDIQFLVDAVARAPKRVILALVGAGSMAEELKQKHGIENRLHCTGQFVGRKEVALAMRAADCAVSASTMETVGFTAMEALSCGTPMIAANAQGFALHLTHGENARLYAPGDEASFDKELAFMLKCKPEGSWSREALRASMDCASVEKCTDVSLQVYSLATKAKARTLRLIASLFFMLLNIFFVRNFFG